MTKQNFDIDIIMQRVEDAVEKYPKAAMFELADKGFDSPFEQLIACIISIRTKDEVMLPAAQKVFESARIPNDMAELTPEEINELIQKSAFHERKAEQIHTIAKRIVNEYNGSLPCDRSILLSFSGVGPKCANLVMSIACDEPHIAVDVHVHRITNRWGYVDTSSPKRTMKALEEKLPRRYWLDINRLLVPFGKNICTGRNPHCPDCPILDMCQQVGVE